MGSLAGAADLRARAMLIGTETPAAAPAKGGGGEAEAEAETAVGLSDRSPDFP